MLRDAKLRFEELPHSVTVLQEQHVKALATQRASASQSLADALARESAKRREEYEAMVRQARHEHDSIVGALRTELLTKDGELGRAPESYDSLVADRGKAVEAHATPADPQLLVEVLVLRERMAQAYVERKESQEATAIAASHLEASRLAQRHMP